MLAVQYLEFRPELADYPVEKVGEKLAGAGRWLPMTHLLLGWRLPVHLLDACRQEAARLGTAFFRWHPLLAGDGVFRPQIGWLNISASQEPIPGFRCMPEFTFTCLNHPRPREAVLRRLEQILAGGQYQGLFLDRIRFPSPAADPLRQLGCFCSFCQAEADSQGLDLDAVRREIFRLCHTPSGCERLARALFQTGDALLDAFMRFRSSQISALLAEVISRVRDAGLEVGLDCFSPALTRMVGQDLEELGRLADWVKVMVYAHTLGPAGLPYEFLALHDWLARKGVPSPDGLALLSDISGLPLPDRREGLVSPGLDARCLQIEMRRALQSSRAPILAGVELVDIPGVTSLSPEQMRTDLAVILSEKPAGLALSWDLWEMSAQYLQLAGESLRAV